MRTSEVSQKVVMGEGYGKMLWDRVVKKIEELGAIVVFGTDVARAFLRYGVRFSLVVEQMYHVGVRSFSTTVLSGLFVGAIMAIQINLQLKDFGAQTFLGGLSTSVTIRNVGPVLIAFILSGKVGAYTSAELGSMQVTEQMNAIRCLGMDPIRYLILPRLLAVVLSSFLLLVVGLMLTIGGGILISSLDLGINPVNYAQNIPRLVSGWSVGTGILKSFIFGNLIALIACYRGYNTSGGSAGVGKTVRQTAVETLVAIIVTDVAMSQIMTLLRNVLGGLLQW